MGVLNVTPDSFSDGGRYLDPECALARGREMIAQGADLIDVGGESSRPGARPVPVEEELRRVVPVVEALAGETRVSIDTRKPEVALAALRAGANLINDISASLWPIAAESGAGWIAMHMQGSPETMQASPSYQDVVSEVECFLFDKAKTASAAGVAEIWIDPGIGFGKTAEHNLALLAHLDRLAAGPWPVLVGTSRKRFLAQKVGSAGEVDEPRDRVEASVASALWAISLGARMVRVHDVGATRDGISLLAPGGL
jgi:dihydropteroate synthase